jgi:nucleotide-binding universal stress UspA family protein
MERVVLGYDGSPAAVAALEWTAQHCGRTPAKVDVITIASSFTRDREESIRRLADAETFLTDRVPGMTVELHRLEGSMPERLEDFARGLDLVVIGITVGHPVRAALSGWMPLRLASESSAPVCLVPAGWVAGDEPVTVGVADDASSDAALEFAAREARLTSTGLRLVHAWLMPTPSPGGSSIAAVAPETELARHRAALDDAIEDVIAAHPLLSVQSELVREARPAALLKFAAKSSLLVIGTHHRGPLAGALLGSVAQEVLWRADCPVCVVPNDPVSPTTARRRG